MTTDPKNLRLYADELRHALDKHTREELVEMLGYLFKEYVLGAAPAQTGAAALPSPAMNVRRLTGSPRRR